MMSITLENLPVELIYQIHILSRSTGLPLTSRFIYNVLKSAPPSVTARYLPPGLNIALKYPIMSPKVLGAYLIRYGNHKSPVVLPKRLFRNLQSPQSGAHDETSPPLPFLKYLSRAIDGGIAANSYNGYPLARAVFASHVPLVKFLLKERANPSVNNSLALRLAIMQGDLALLKLLVESQDHTIGSENPRKRRKLSNRVDMLSPKLLDLAVRCDAKDIAHWMMQENGVVPAMETIRTLL